MSDAKEAERQAKLQRLGFAHLMLLHRVRAAAVERSEAFDAMLHDLEVNRLFNEGAIYIERG